MAFNAQPLPTKLRRLTLKLDKGNYTQIQTNKRKTKKISFNCGLLQGAPTSPQKFNAATKIVLDNLNEREILNKYGYRITESVHPITNMAFADDTCTIGNSRDSAAYLVSETVQKFNEIGLEINYEKSVAIIIEDGCLSQTETIRYLGVTFAEEIKFDETRIIQNLNEKLNKIVSTVCLRPDQKLNVINLYIFPTLVYPFQTAPLCKLKKSFLTDVDKIIRHSVKEILQIPDDTPNNMLYSSTSMKGFSLMRAEWEAYIQNINALTVLKRANHYLVSEIKDIEGDIKLCLKKLDLPDNFLIEHERNKKEKPSELLRKELRKREYAEWQRLKSKGRGVELFEDCPRTNRKLFNKYGLNTSEWITYFKMIGSVTSVRDTPGRSTETNRCRINSCNEIETLAHVLGACRQGELLRNHRHNKVVRIIANELRKNKWTVNEEFSCIETNGSNRRVDILAFDEKNKNGFIIDPTVRFEYDKNQPEEGNEEKRRIYENCIPDIQKKLNLKEIIVIGIFVGARGTITTFFKEFCKRFKISNSIIDEIALEVVRGSCRIYHNHIYDPQNT